MEDKMKDLEKAILLLTTKVSALEGNIADINQGLLSMNSEVSNLSGELNVIKNDSNH